MNSKPPTTNPLPHLEMGEDDHCDETTAAALAVQREEYESMVAIFSDDVMVLNHNDPISYSINLKPDFSSSDTTHADDLSVRLPADLALIVTYPPSYPDFVTPIFRLSYNRAQLRLHNVQEQALLKVVTTAAEVGMPSVYGCVIAACDFLKNGGLAQAGISLLSDDCLACVLSYLATTPGRIDEICIALPVFGAASKSNSVWKQLCRLRWSEQWGFAKRWDAHTKKFQTQSDPHFWMRVYDDEEEDGKRDYLTRDELCAMKFDFRQWFSFNLFRNQPVNMRDVLPTGLRDSIAGDVVFSADGEVKSDKEWLRRLSWKSNVDDAVTEVTLTLTSLAQRRSPIECFSVHRLADWNWELRGADYVLRPIDNDFEVRWEDLTKAIVVQEKPEWVETHRSPYPYTHREVPNDEDYKSLLDW